jgi:hypothetical protein
LRVEEEVIQADGETTARQEREGKKGSVACELSRAKKQKEALSRYGPFEVLQPD